MPRSLGPAWQAIRAVSIGLVLALPLGTASAADRCKMSWELSAANSKYTQQLVMDVGDVPGHQVRLYELHRTYPNDKPNCEGLKRVEIWTRGYSDYIDRNGHTWGYEVTTLENGDKIFAEWTGTSQFVLGPDGSKKGSFEGTATWTGGTGKYLGVRGIERDHVVFDIDKGLNQQRGEAEYWFDK